MPIRAAVAAESAVPKRNFLPFTASVEVRRDNNIVHSDLGFGAELTITADGMGAIGNPRLNKNYTLVFASSIATSTAKQLASAQLVLPFIYLALGAPVIFAGLLLPLMLIAQLAAELLSAPFLQEVAWAKRSVLLTTLVSAAALAVIAVTAADAPRNAVVALFLATAIALGICRGVLKVGYGQLFGVVVPSELRILITFSVALVTGLVAIAIAVMTADLLASDHPLQRHIVVLWLGIFAMIAAAGLIAGVRVVEKSEHTPHALHFLPLLDHIEHHRLLVLRDFAKDSRIRRELWRGFRTGMQFPWYRRFGVWSILALSVLLAMPFYTLHAATYQKGIPHALAILVIAASAGMAAGSPYWRRVASRSHKRVMVLGTFVAAASAVLALLLDFAHLVGNVWLYALVIFLLGFAATGVRNAAYLYFIEMTSARDRPCLMAFKDLAVGIVAIGLSIVLGVVARWSNPTIPIMLLLGANVVAALFALSLVESAVAAEPGRSKPEALATTVSAAGQPAAG